MSIDEMIAVLQAFKDGKPIQSRAHGMPDLPWSTLQVGSPLWDFVRYEYRVKPEPLVIYANVYRNADGSEYIGCAVGTDRDEVLRNCSCAVRRGAKFVEVE